MVLAARTVSRTAHFALHRLDLGEPGDSAAVSTLFPLDAAGSAWIGAMTPKRWARRAVTRNSIRRQIYGSSEAFERQLAGAAYVVRLRAAFDRAQFVSATSDLLKRAVRAELRQLFVRLPSRAPEGAVAPVALR